MGGQGGCDRRIEVFVKIQKQKNWGVGGSGGEKSGWGGGGQGRCDRRIEVFGKIHKKKFGRGVRVDLNGELKFFFFFFFFFGGGGGPGMGGRVGGSGWM